MPFKDPKDRAAYLKKYNAKPSEKKRRAARGRARYALMKKGRVKEGDGKDVDHKNRNPHDNRPSNLRVVSRKFNRSRKR